MFCRGSFRSKLSSSHVRLSIVRTKSATNLGLVGCCYHDMTKTKRAYKVTGSLVDDELQGSVRKIFQTRKIHSISPWFLTTRIFSSPFSNFDANNARANCHFVANAKLLHGACLTSFSQRRTITTRASDSDSQERKSDSHSKKESPHDVKTSFSRSSVVVKVKDLEEHLRIRGYSTLRWGLVILAATGIGIYMFREPIKDNLSDEVADVATRSLGDQNVVLRANEVSKAIVNEILNDSNTLELASDFVIKLLKSDDVLNKAMEFVATLMNAPETRKHVTQLATDTVANVLENESTRKLLLDYIQNILMEKATIESCKELLNSVAADPQSKQILADFFKSVLISDTVTDQAISLGKNVSREVVTDKMLQEESVNALWNVFKMSLTPGWFVSSKEISKKHELDALK